MLGLFWADDDEAKPTMAIMIIKVKNISSPLVLFILSSFLILGVIIKDKPILGSLVIISLYNFVAGRLRVSELGQI